MYVREHPTKVVQCVVHSLPQRHSRLQLRLEGVLHMAEHVARAGQSERHGAQFAEDLVPLTHTGPLLSYGDAGKDFG